MNDRSAQQLLSYPSYFFLMLLLFLAQTSRLNAQQAAQARSISDLTSPAKSETSKQRSERLSMLQTARPETTEDVNALVSAAHTNETDLQDAAAKALKNVSPTANNLGNTYIALLNDSSEKIQEAAIHGCAKLGMQDSAPRILTLLKKQSRAKFTAVNLPWMTVDHMQYVDEAAQALADLHYEPAIDEILSRDELMINSGFGGPLVAQYGATALPKLITVARKNDQRRNGCIQGIVYIRDESAVPDLIYLLDDPDPELARSAMHALSEVPVKAESNRQLIQKALESRLKNADRFTRGYAYAGLLRLDPQKNMPFAMAALRKDSLARVSILHALIRTPNKEAVPYLKEFIRMDETREPNYTNDRAVAAEAIYKATGERVPYKGVEQALDQYKKGFSPDPYDPYGSDGAHLKK